MKERSLYFRGPTADAMVRAVLAGTKTQHRLPVKTPVPSSPPKLDWLYPNIESSRQSYGYYFARPNMLLPDSIACISPFGGPADRLRIKECWAISVAYDSYGTVSNHVVEVAYRAGGGFDFEHERGRWRPSTHMPRWAERIVLPITRVWIEHVQDISREGALAEGHVGSGFGPRYDFRRLWDSIYADKGYGFGENPWVWGCEFEKEGI